VKKMTGAAAAMVLGHPEPALSVVDAARVELCRGCEAEAVEE